MQLQKKKKKKKKKEKKRHSKYNYKYSKNNQNTVNDSLKENFPILLKTSFKHSMQQNQITTSVCVCVQSISTYIHTYSDTQFTTCNYHKSK